MDIGDFDDDFFETKPVKKIQDVTEIIRAYKPKIVTSERFLNEKPCDIDDLANWFKTNGDYHYFKSNFDQALENYQQSLETSSKSNSLNNTIFQRELRESICRSFSNLKNFTKALEIASELQETSTNFEQYSTSLNVHLGLLDNLSGENLNQKNNEDKIKILCKILILYPLYVSIWMKLYDCLITRASEHKFKIYSLICLQIIKEINKHGNKSRSEIFAEQKLKRQAWFNEAINMLDSAIVEKYFSNSEMNEINQKLETIDKMEDNEKLNQARALENILINLAYNRQFLFKLN
ncbi:hypothetical protein BpHYR1_022952 [Brachionus plicatilis]|uniref:Uncharacterized protein n=1 Tax=Brachionus plicatilis TaxID=10195 RepID=A0A3M7PV16_BRAPC|nr:hypothetical protein BpHYR1_022952 [Brachionus plicatilis]